LRRDDRGFRADRRIAAGRQRPARIGRDCLPRHRVHRRPEFTRVGTYFTRRGPVRRVERIRKEQPTCLADVDAQAQIEVEEVILDDVLHVEGGVPRLGIVLQLDHEQVIRAQLLIFIEAQVMKVGKDAQPQVVMVADLRLQVGTHHVGGDFLSTEQIIRAASRMLYRDARSDERLDEVLIRETGP
jgi:hypothetical protein